MLQLLFPHSYLLAILVFPKLAASSFSTFLSCCSPHEDKQEQEASENTLCKNPPGQKSLHVHGAATLLSM